MLFVPFFSAAVNSGELLFNEFVGEHPCRRVVPEHLQRLSDIGVHHVSHLPSRVGLPFHHRHEPSLPPIFVGERARVMVRMYVSIDGNPPTHYHRFLSSSPPHPASKMEQQQREGISSLEAYNFFLLPSPLQHL
jgi:hypothetical protein